MATETPTPPPDFAIEIAPGNLAVTLTIPAAANPSAQAIIAKLHESGIHKFDDGAMLEALEKRKGAALSHVILQGTPAVDERPGKLDYRVPLSDAASGTISKVEQGTMLACIGPSVPGTDGKDIMGNAIPCKKSVPVVVPGRNVTVDKNQMTASMRGSVRVVDGQLRVDPLLELQGRADIAANKIVFDGDVSIKGSLEDNKSLQATGCVIIAGALEAAQLSTDGSVHVRGGILGKGKGKTMVHGDVRCRFVNGGWIAAGGEVVVQGEVVRSHITCTGKLTVAHGPIHGSDVSANGGIHCLALGNASGMLTSASAGIDQTQQMLNAAKAAEVEANRKHARTVREKIEPLMERMKYLTPKQRERATELLAEASEIEEKTEQALAELAQCKQQVNDKSCAEILVDEMIHPGVTVRFPGLEAVVRSPIKGPVKLAVQVVGHTQCIVAMIPGSHNIIPLDSKPTATSTKQAA